MATKSDNPFRIPKQFPNIIKYINKLSDGTVPPTAQCRIVTHNNREYLIETKGGTLYILGDGYGHASDHLSGVLANRFCSSIYSFVGLLTKLKPSVTKEVEDFLVWLRVENEKIKVKRDQERLENEADSLGYKLVARG